MRVLLIATYEMGRQPFGLASPAAMLRAAGHAVETVDAALDRVPAEAVRKADLIGIHLPMHTATRLAAPLISKMRQANPGASICCYGLYAPLNRDYLRSLGVSAILGGEFESGLLRLAAGTGAEVADRVVFHKPDRSTLPILNRYAGLVRADGGGTLPTGYTEATRGCKHLCRHCPVVPVYKGKFRAVPLEAVLADVRQQVAAGARHITFGDPDFWNGPTHAARIVEALHREWPGVTYDVTIKVEHLLRHREMLPSLVETGCLFVTTAVESLDDEVLALLNKGHSRADFLTAVQLAREVGLMLSPTFIPFTPWTTLAAYRELLATLAELQMQAQVAPIQLALRLLITNGSPLLELDDVRRAITRWDQAALTHRWRHADPEVDALSVRLISLVDVMQKRGAGRAEIFSAIAAEAGVNGLPVLTSRATVPYLTEPWYC